MNISIENYKLERLRKKVTNNIISNKLEDIEGVHVIRSFNGNICGITMGGRKFSKEEKNEIKDIYKTLKEAK